MLLAGLLPLSRVAAQPAAGEANVPATRMWWFPDLADWTRAEDTVAGAIVFTSPRIDPPFRWSEAVLSWNAPTNLALVIEALPDGAPRAYTLGKWCADTNAAPRSSVAGQRDGWGKVDTDTLVTSRPAGALRVRVRARSIDAREIGATTVRIGISLLAAADFIAPPPANRAAWGKSLEVPVRSQADYPEGVQSWCSPTSLTMLHEWWRAHGLPGIAEADVRDTARGVDDPAWPGTGNWPFNTAFAGQQPGLSACVARLAGIADLEAWIAAGRPVAASVSYAQLKGGPWPLPGDGHLVVVGGFTETGDVRINDPGVRRERVSRVVPRATFDRAWSHSHRTVYLLWPTRAGATPGGDGRW